MANTNAPTISTYSTVRVPLAGDNTSRNPALKKDRWTVNMIPEYVGSELTGEKDICLKKRSGTTLLLTLPVGEGRGTFYFSGHNFSVVGNGFYFDTTLLTTLSTSTGSVGFTTFNGSVNQYLIMLDGINGYAVNTAGTLTTITSPNFPTPHVPSPVSQDGYLLVAGLNSDNIYNSNLEDPFTWTSGNFISAEMYPDYVTALTRVKNYFVAVGTGSLEFFYNPGTITSGSPFQRNDSAFKRIGCIRPGSIDTLEDQVFFVSVGDGGGESVFMLDGFNLTEIADITVKKSLEISRVSQPNQVTNGYVVRENGHKYYVLNLSDNSFQITWVYDVMAKWWGEWTYNDLNTKFPYDYAAYLTDYRVLLQNKLTGSLYILDPNVYQDAGLPITTRIQTSKMDFNTIRYKDHNRLSFVMDLGNVTDSNAVPVTIATSWSDDDYSTWTTRNVLVTDTFTSTHKLGKARRRSYRFDITANTSYRIEEIELDINTMGT